ncbi:MAG: M28 family peptidase [Candidatus Aureabacteria bacterium]|nr:M28 family peptidase [Candidatus Auribacterota bacterium]
MKILSDDIGDKNVFKHENLKKSARYIEKTLSEAGYEVALQAYVADSAAVENIIAEKKGSKRPDEIVLVGAHYDTCLNPGADDNASAVAGLLEIARMFSEKDVSRTIRFVAFVNEEPPFYKTEKMGSYVYARKAREKDENIRAAIILEMIGYDSNEPGSQSYPPMLGFFYPDKGNFIAIVGNLRYKWLVRRVKRRFKEQTFFSVESLAAPGFVPGVDFSDHWSFWKWDYPAVMITDTAFYRSPHYHRNSDTYETLDYGAMAEVVQAISKAVEELIKQEKIE